MNRSLVRLGGWLLVASLPLTSGCLVPRGMEKTAPEVHVIASPRPQVITGLPRVDTNRVEIALVPAERSALSSDADRRFAAAREAFWNHDTEAAEALLRGLLRGARPGGQERHLQRLIADCHAQDGRWDEAAARMEEFNLATCDREGYEHARFMAGLPPREITFGTNAASFPFDLRLGQLVVTTVRVNGREAAAFIDTGFSMSFVTEAFSRRSGLKTYAHSIALSDANGKKRAVKLGMMDRLELGGLRAVHVPVVCGPDRHLSRMLGAVEVVIGWDVLQHADVTWDFPARRMSVAAPVGPVVAEPWLGGGGRRC